MKGLIKIVFLDIYSLYKKFFRWNIEKIKISLFSFLLGILVSIPFFLIAWIIAYFSNIDWMQIVSALLYQNSLILDIIMNNPVTFFSVSIFFVLWVISLLFWIFYSIILLFKLSLNFIKGDYKLEFKKDYFNFKIILNFFKLLNLNFLILLWIFLIYLLEMFIVVLLFWGIWNIQTMMLGGSKIFPIISLILFIIFALVFFYSIYRLIFSFIILIDDKHNKWSIDCIKKSYKLTSSKLSFFKFILLGFLLLLVSIPWATYSKYLDNTYNKINDYIYYSNLWDKDQKKLLKTSKAYYYNNLNIEYASYDKVKLNSDLSFFNNMQKIYFVISYLLFYWIMYMFFVSFYIRELKKSWEHFKWVKSFIKKIKEHKVL